MVTTTEKKDSLYNEKIILCLSNSLKSNLINEITHKDFNFVIDTLIKEESELLITYGDDKEYISLFTSLNNDRNVYGHINEKLSDTNINKNLREFLESELEDISLSIESTEIFLEKVNDSYSKVGTFENIRNIVNAKLFSTSKYSTLSSKNEEDLEFSCTCLKYKEYVEMIANNYRSILTPEYKKENQLQKRA